MRQNTNIQREQNLESPMLNEQGTTNTLSFPARRPYDSDYIVLSISSDLELDDGTTTGLSEGVRVPTK